MSYYNAEHYPDPTAWMAHINIDRQARATQQALALAERDKNMTTITFRVPGTPQGKQRPEFRRRGRFTTAYTPDKTKRYEQEVLARYKAAGGVYLLPPIRVDILMVYEVPKSYTKARRQECAMNAVFPGTKPDVDNVAKAVLDALNKEAYEDDSRVSTLVVTKRYGDHAGVVVKVSGVLPNEQQQLENVGG